MSLAELWQSFGPTPPNAVSPWVYFSCMIGAMVIIGIAKAGFGGGLGILAVPLTAVALPADRAVGVLLPVLIVADILSNAHHRRGHDWPALRWLWPGAVLGVAAGTLVIWWFDKTDMLAMSLNLVIGSICLVFVAIQLYRTAGGYLPRVPTNRRASFVTGAISGITSSLAHAAGPIMSLYMLERKADKKRLTATLVLFFFVLNVMKLPTYVGLGLIRQERLIEGLWFLPAIAVGTVLGAWMHKRIPQTPFNVLIYLGAAAAAGNMIYKALGG